MTIECLIEAVQRWASDDKFLVFWVAKDSRVDDKVLGTGECIPSPKKDKGIQMTLLLRWDADMQESKKYLFVATDEAICAKCSCHYQPSDVSTINSRVSRDLLSSGAGLKIEEFLQKAEASYRAAMNAVWHNRSLVFAVVGASCVVGLEGVAEQARTFGYNPLR